MPNPATHLIYGYLVSKNLADKKKFIIIGLATAILVDIDGLHLPFLRHHGLTHTPFFVLMISIAVFAVTRSQLLFKLSLFNMLLHIGLDTVATTIPVMWFYPFSTFSFAVGGFVPLSILYTIKVTLLVVPIYYILRKYYAEEIDPVELYHYLTDRIGTVQTYAMISFLTGLTVYIWIFDYLIEVI